MRKCTLATFPAPQKKFHLPISIKNFPINKRISELKKIYRIKKPHPIARMRPLKRRIASQKTAL